MKRDNIIFFIGGAVIGALGGFFGAKSYYQKFYLQQAEDTVEAMKEIVYGTPRAEETLSEEEEESVNPVKWTKEQAEETRKRLELNHRGTNYAAIYGQIKKGEISDEETDSEDAEDSEADETEDPEPEIVTRREESKRRKPHLISADRAAELPAGVDLVELQFYDDDEVLVDGDTEERISDVQRVVGDCLTKYGFIDSDEPVIYVMNDELDTCYEIIRVEANYEETHPE